MRNLIRSAVLALGLLPGFALAQSSSFPQTLPANTVAGRLGISAGPVQAIPFAAFLNNLTLANGKILIGSAGNLATPQTMSGDATLSTGGALTLATVNANTGAIGSATQCITVTNNAKGLTTAVTTATCTPAIGSITGLGTGIATALGKNVGTAGAPVLFNGALGTPSSGTLTSATGLPISTGLTGAGTGVLTALGVNVGTAGSVLVNGGVLGTPSSGTVTNLTGTASININGTVGATTPTTGAFTTATASTSVTSPLHIGGSGTTGTQLTLKSTTGNGTTDQTIFTGGNNGATRIATFLGTGKVGLGSSVGAQTPTNTTVAVSNNVTAVDAATPGLTPSLHVVGADAALNSIILDGFGNQPGFAFRRAVGTAASPTVVIANSVLGSFFGTGYDASGSKWGYGGEIDFYSSETWSATAHGAGIRFWSVVNATTTQVNSATLFPSGGFAVGNTTDPGIGKVSANVGFTAAGSAGLSVTKTVRASGGAADCTLIYTGGILTGGTC